MSTLEKEIEDFAQFARSRSSEGMSLDDLYDRWRMQVYTDADEMAVKASLSDMEQGEKGRLFEDFAEDFRNRNSTDDTQN